MATKQSATAMYIEAREQRDDKAVSPATKRRTLVAILRALESGDVVDAQDERADVRRDVEEDLLDLAAKGKAADKKRGAAEWVAFATRRIKDGELDELWKLGILMKKLGIKKVPPEIAADFKRGWAEQRLAVACRLQNHEDGKRTWADSAVPLDAGEARLCMRAAYRAQRWHQVVACAEFLEGFKGLIPIKRASFASKKQERIDNASVRDHVRTTRLVALLRRGTPDHALMRETLVWWNTRKSYGGSREGWMIDFDSLAATAIMYGVGAQPGDKKLLQDFAKAWSAGDSFGHDASPVLLS